MALTTITLRRKSGEHITDLTEALEYLMDIGATWKKIPKCWENSPYKIWLSVNAVAYQDGTQTYHTKAAFADQEDLTMFLLKYGHLVIGEDQ